MRKYFFIIIGLCFSLLGCSQTTVVDTISVVEARNLIISNRSIIIIDGRDSSKYRERHLPNAINIDAFAENVESELLKLSPTNTYLVYCTTRIRSDKMCEIMRKNNFHNIIQMTEGYKEWKAHNFEIEP